MAGEGGQPDEDLLEGISPELRAELIAVLSPAVETEETIAVWFAAREPEPEWESPAGWLISGRDPDAVLEQGWRYAARLAQ